MRQSQSKVFNIYISHVFDVIFLKEKATLIDPDFRISTIWSDKKHK